MEKNADYYRQLLERYLKNECNPAEVEEILDHLQTDAASRMLLSQMRAEFRQAMDTEPAADQEWSGRVRRQLEDRIGAGLGAGVERQVKVAPLAQESSEASGNPEVPGRSMMPVNPVVPGSPVVPLRRVKWLRVAAAAVLLVVGSVTGYYMVHRDREQVLPPAIAINKDGGLSAPDRIHKTILTLADGSVITLDTAGNGKLSQQGSVQVVKQTNGQLVYQVAPRKREPAIGGPGPGTQSSSSITYNSITTPRGRIYEVVLADGTKVWLNAATTLKFPTVFTGKERVVELEGEAYLEVAKNPAMPFKVAIRTPSSVAGTGDDRSGNGGSGDGHSGAGSGRRMQVEVLGTHFNVMAYPDEAMVNTTLLEGSVRVRTDVSAALLRVGQQASVDRLSGPVKVAETNTEAAIAWKLGLFQFDEAPVQMVMHQVARWYDMDVVYEGGANKHFSGMISRSMQLSKALKIIEVAGKVHFRVEGRTITVLRD